MKEKLPSDHFRVKIATAITPAFADLSANYGRVDRSWSKSKNIVIHESLRDFTPPIGKVTIFVKKFNRPTTSDRAIKWTEKHGYRLAFPWEREAFSKANPDLQRKSIIVDLGTINLCGIYRFVPVLSEINGRRYLSSNWYIYPWDADIRFLFAVK